MRRSVARCGVLLALIALVPASCKKNRDPVETSPFIDVIITPPTPVVQVGGQITLTAKVTGPGGVSQAVVWSAIDTEIVSVTSAGVVTGLADGSGRVRAAWALDQDIWRQVFVQVTTSPVEGELDPRSTPLRVQPTVRR